MKAEKAGGLGGSRVAAKPAPKKASGKKGK
jgi:hypothetical protein